VFDAITDAVRRGN